MADDVAPAEQELTTDALEAPETGQADGGEEESFIGSFNLDEIPDEARPQVEALQKEWQGKYTQTRQAEKQEIAEAHREAEQLRQFRDALSNPQVAPAVLAQLGYDERKILDMYGYQAEQEEQEEPDLYEQVARLEGKLTAREQAETQAQQAEAVTDFISGEIEKLEKKEDREFDGEEHQLLDAYARAYAQNGVPNVEGAYQLLSGIVDSRQKQWIESKKTSRPPGGGKPGSRTVDLSKESEEDFTDRVAAAVDQARASAQ